MDLEFHSIQIFLGFIHLQVLQCPLTFQEEIQLLIEREFLPIVYQLK